MATCSQKFDGLEGNEVENISIQKYSEPKVSKKSETIQKPDKIGRLSPKTVTSSTKTFSKSGFQKKKKLEKYSNLNINEHIFNLNEKR